jgi:hypothetical protein
MQTRDRVATALVAHEAEAIIEQARRRQRRRRRRIGLELVAVVAAVGPGPGHLADDPGRRGLQLRRRCHHVLRKELE